jgi:tripartite-type tricarboxylate transporter receptor subunit TctC
LAFHVGLTYGPGLFKKLPYDIKRDFQPVSLIGVAPSLVVVNPASPAKSVSELIALAKMQPGSLNFASAGIGSSSHLAAELLQIVSGAKLTHVPYRGGAPAVTATMAGETQLMIETSASVLQHIKSGRLRALAVTGESRLADLPDVPTMKEAGVNDYVYTTWFGLWAPAGTPRTIVDKLNQATKAALDKPVTKQGLARAGVEARHSTVADFEKLVSGDLEKWTGIIKRAGIEPE